MASILTSKILSPFQKKCLLKAGFQVVEHDFIKIEAIGFNMPKEVKNAIFTSQNAVKRVIGPPAGRAGYELRAHLPDGQVKSYGLGILNCYCVGEKTKKLLEKNGMNVIASAEYGKDLAEIIVEKYPNEHFTFFCGNRRRDELPSILKENKVSFEEIQVYKTILNPKKIEQKLDGILFFSPSGVKSYIKGQIFGNVDISAFAGAHAFCIGRTTAAEAKKYLENVMVAEKPSVESVIDLTCKVLRDERSGSL
ncbi:MAG TPA: uroporphyrinogen-III synthase [Salinimicrobium sp.]|nr:uroporphyrinogen-III synthase [Salinimicrobium sp.]